MLDGLGLPAVPDLATFWRILTAVDPLELDQALGSWLAAGWPAAARRGP